MSDELEFNFDVQETSADEGRLIYTVSQINNEIKLVLEDSYPAIWLEGEISNFKRYSSGHMYFSLKDDNAQIKAVMFKQTNIGLNFAPEDGMKVLIFGRVSSYPVRGDYQVIVSRMEKYGKGDLQEAFEKLKAKLGGEGLFDESAKKTLPKLVNKIGVVTSRDGAALHDILKVLDDLKADVEVLIYPVRVQGKEAEKEITQAIRYLNANHKELDVLLIGRGGGSIEDLQAFNTETLARAIFNSEIATVSCVGHEVDFTIADFVADLRAPTPSAAAEMVVRGKAELKNNIDDFKASLAVNVNFILENAQRDLDRLADSRALKKPHLIYEDKIAYIDDLDERLKRNTNKFILSKDENLKNIAHKLDLVSPLSVLKRGFSVCKNSSGKIIKDSSLVNNGELIDIRVDKGNIKAVVTA